MQALVDNWYLLVAFGACVAAITVMVMKFVKQPTSTKVTNIKEWLKWAVTEAEKQLGSGTGQLKLRLVYDMAVKQFPWLIQVVTFETFSEWVDEALEWMRLQLSQNINAQNYVQGE